MSKLGVLQEPTTSTKIKELKEMITSSKASHTDVYELLEETKKTTHSLVEKIPKSAADSSPYFIKKMRIVS